LCCTIKCILLYVSHLKRTLTLNREELRCRTVVTHVWHYFLHCVWIITTSCRLGCFKVMELKLYQFDVNTVIYACFVCHRFLRSVLWSAFAKLRRAATSFVMSMSARLSGYGTVWLWLDGFSWNLIRIFSKIRRYNWSLIKIVQE
jgi:hypothetical protein